MRVAHRQTTLQFSARVFAAAVAALCYSQLACAGEELPTVRMQIVKAASPGEFSQHRKILVSPTVNTPEPFAGFGGFCGWPKICRLKGGDLFVTFSAGYWHYSPPTPLEKYETAEYVEHLTKNNPFLKSWKCPTGGQMMWIRSRDNGKTWTRPKAFPIVHGATAITDVYQMSDGTMVAVALVEVFRSLRFDPPNSAVEFARATADRLPMEQVFFSSRDNGETWQIACRLKGPFLFMTTSHDFAESPDGSLLLLTAAVPIPAGKAWGPGGGRFVSVLMHSTDHAASWKTVSVIGEREFDVEEGALAVLPDGSLGFASRTMSAWFRSRDGGRTWSKPRKLHAGSGKLFKKGDHLVLPDGTNVILCSGGPGGDGQVFYSRNSGTTWIKPARDRGFRFDPLAYYPDGCVLGDGSIFVVGDHQKLKNQFGPYGAEVTAMRFRIRSAEEGDGIELLPIGE